MFRAAAAAIYSITYPVFGVPTGTGVDSTGGIATHTPTENMFLYLGLR